ncbi:TPA: PD-(D/E)XK nuclease domain-containing protein [Morganella morganii]|nr:PD-(D/E)XK nuclease domain-containing protein [Morganella morganii]
MLKAKIDLLKRNNALEEEIDRKWMENYLDNQSLTIFQNYLYDFGGKDYNPTDIHQYNRLYSFIRYRHFPRVIDYIYSLNSVFSQEEADYIVSMSEQFKKIKDNILNNTPTRSGLITKISMLCAESLAGNNHIEYILNKIKNILNSYNRLTVSIYTHEDCGEVFFHNNNTSIYIIENWRMLRARKNNKFKIVILKENLNTLNGDLQKLSLIEKIYYPYNDKKIGCLHCFLIPEMFNESLSTIVYRLNQDESSQFHLSQISNIIDSIRRNILLINNYKDEYGNYRNEFLIDILTQLKKNYKELMIYFRYSFVAIRCKEAVQFVISRINNAIGFLIPYLNLDCQLTTCLSEIKKNNALYIASIGKKGEDKVFGEENLSAILASNLRCLNINNDVTVVCEAQTGNGRSDIQISHNNNIIGIIESKFIRKDENITKEIKEGLCQLYDRYSENISINIDEGIKLHLIIFTIDKKFPVMEDKINKAINEFKNACGVDVNFFPRRENQVTFIFERITNENVFKSKKRTITMHLCNLELDFRKLISQAKKLN